MQRKRYAPEFKAKVAFEALKGEDTLSSIASKYGIHPNQITTWKKQLQSGMKEVFKDGRKKTGKKSEELENKLYEEIGRLKFELDWLKKKL
jgi:transposase-like protein